MTTSYKITLGRLIHIKWPLAADKEWWYTKQTMSNRRKLQRLHAKQNGRCVFCDVETWLRNPSVQLQHKRTRNMATLEHITPQSQGGSYASSNLSMSCHACNNIRGTMDYQEFMEARRDPVAWKAFTTRRAHGMRDRSVQRSGKSEARRAALVWNLAILFYLHTNFG